MASQRFSIERSELLPKLGGGTHTFSVSREISAMWLDERGEALEHAELEEVVLPPVEWPGKEQSIMAAAGDRLVMSRTSPPEAAHSIQFRRGGETATFAADSAVEPWATERMTPAFGGDEDRYEVRIFSELFTDFDRFEGMVEAFYDALRQVAPFSRVALEGKLRVVGHYARSTRPDGHFRTIVQGEPGERRIHGDVQYARSRLDRALNAMPALILIDSTMAGGAGGTLSRGLPYWPAWSSLGAMTATASWQMVAIHEFAHGFGLSDEYVDKTMREPFPEKYANVSNATLASELRWNDLAQLPAATALPTHNEAGVPTGQIAPGRSVAAYQGAYYSDHDWRPSLTCRMRNYDPGGFCPVCSRIILGVYGMR